MIAIAVTIVLASISVCMDILAVYFWVGFLFYFLVHSAFFAVNAFLAVVYCA